MDKALDFLYNKKYKNLKQFTFQKETIIAKDEQDDKII